MIKTKPSIITLTSDFGVQSQGVGIMEAVIYSIAPAAKVIHLMHGLPEFDIAAAARTLETLDSVPVGCHVCVCDPGVGTSRRGLIVQMERGDYLIGPDNGVLLPAAKFLGGIKVAHSILNPEYMLQPVSPVFHGRDVFAPAAAHLFNGVQLKEFGNEVSLDSLILPPYNEAYEKDESIVLQVIHINKYGSVHLNMTHEMWNKYKLGSKNELEVILPNSHKINVKVGITFGDVPKGEPVVLKDDYGRIELAVNQGSFAEKYLVGRGNEIIVMK